MKYLKKYYQPLIFTTIVITILIMTVRGLPGNPTAEQMQTEEWKTYGPLELSPEIGRYALTYSIVEDHSLQFSLPLARAVTPDLGIIGDEFVSLFAPGLSIAVIPGYLLGRSFNLAQLGTYLIVSLFALTNTLLVVKISEKLGANRWAAALSGLIFIFATPAFAYSGTLFQHHLTVLLLLASVNLSLSDKLTTIKQILIWVFTGMAVSVDYPNALIFSPVIIYNLTRNIKITKNIQNVKFDFKYQVFAGIIGFIITILGLFAFNHYSHYDAFKLTGTLKRVVDITPSGKPIFSGQKELVDSIVVKDQKVEVKKKSAIGFFRTRNLWNGFYIHFVSPDRGILFFSPIMLISFIGAYLLYQKHKSPINLFIGIIGVNIILYSLWGDPYGGWGFGSRYLIPTYAVASTLLSLAITKYFTRNWFIISVLILVYYSVGINTLGALTTNLNPPKIEIAPNETFPRFAELYTPLRNITYLQDHGTKSFLYHSYFGNYLEPIQYYWIVYVIIVSSFTSIIINLISNQNKS